MNASPRGWVLSASPLALVLVSRLICPLEVVAGTNTFNEKSIKQWTLKGPLSKPPERLSEVVPLSDQQNKAGWVKFEPMWDEFDQPMLDTNKWTVGMSWWQGRQPAWFNPQNVAVRDGQLHLTMRREEVPGEMKAKGYHDYSSAALVAPCRRPYFVVPAEWSTSTATTVPVVASTTSLVFPGFLGVVMLKAQTSLPSSSVMVS